jgi:hypothetical protein
MAIYVSVVLYYCQATRFIQLLNRPFVQLNFTTKNVLAVMHTSVELETFIIRFLMACVSVFVVSMKWMSVAELVLACRLVWVMLWWQPQVYGWVNHIRVGM